MRVRQKAPILTYKTKHRDSHSGLRNGVHHLTGHHAEWPLALQHEGGGDHGWAYYQHEDIDDGDV